jgi:hypothetical protein
MKDIWRLTECVWQQHCCGVLLTSTRSELYSCKEKKGTEIATAAWTKKETWPYLYINTVLQKVHLFISQISGYRIGLLRLVNHAYNNKRFFLICFIFQVLFFAVNIIRIQWGYRSKIHIVSARSFLFRPKLLKTSDLNNYQRFMKP